LDVAAAAYDAELGFETTGGCLVEKSFVDDAAGAVDAAVAAGVAHMEHLVVGLRSIAGEQDSTSEDLVAFAMSPRHTFSADHVLKETRPRQESLIEGYRWADTVASSCERRPYCLEYFLQMSMLLTRQVCKGSRGVEFGNMAIPRYCDHQVLEHSECTAVVDGLGAGMRWSCAIEEGVVAGDVLEQCLGFEIVEGDADVKGPVAGGGEDYDDHSPLVHRAPLCILRSVDGPSR